MKLEPVADDAGCDSQHQGKPLSPVRLSTGLWLARGICLNSPAAAIFAFRDRVGSLREEYARCASPDFGLGVCWRFCE